MRIRQAITAATAALLLVGCTDTADTDVVDSTSPDVEDPETTAVEPDESGLEELDQELASEPEPELPPTNVRYDSVYDLRERVEHAGVTCEDWAILSNPEGAIERATCTSAIVVSIHESATQVQQAVDFSAEIVLEFGLPAHHVVGPNWSVNCGSEDVCVALRESLGGEVDSREP